MNRCVVSAAVLAVVGSVGQLEAQRQPGVGYMTSWEVAEASLTNEALRAIKPTIEEWQAAWGLNDVEVLSDLFAEVSMLFFADRLLIGRESIREYFEEIVPSVASFSMGMTDFQVSGRMARMVGTYAYQIYENGRFVERIEGPYIASLLREDGKWRIRDQMFRTPFPG